MLVFGVLTGKICSFNMVIQFFIFYLKAPFLRLLDSHVSNWIEVPGARFLCSREGWRRGRSPGEPAWGRSQPCRWPHQGESAPPTWRGPLCSPASPPGLSNVPPCREPNTQFTCMSVHILYAKRQHFSRSHKKLDCTNKKSNCRFRFLLKLVTTCGPLGILIFLNLRLKFQKEWNNTWLEAFLFSCIWVIKNTQLSRNS